MEQDRNGYLVILLGAASLLFSSCSEEKDNTSQGEDSLRTDPHFPEFLQHAASLERSSNRYFGHEQLTLLRKRLEQPALSPNQRRSLLAQLAFHHLRLGDVKAARLSIDSAFAGEPQPAYPELLPLLKTRAMVSLREAEVENCIKRHNAECCIFPLQGGGLHEVAAPAREATRDLLEILRVTPGDEMVQWLLNLSTMATGGYPREVPGDFRIPPGYFEVGEAGSGIKPFIDVAPQLQIDAFDLCGGVAAEDFNRDGWCDILTSTSDPRGSLRLFLTRNGLHFQESTTEAGLDGQLGGFNCLTADYDNDGDVDLLVLRGAWLGTQGEIRNSLLRNDTPEGGHPVRFTDVTAAAGLEEPARPTQSGAWLDFDRDGDLDLFIGNESGRELPRGQKADYPSQLFRNNGDGTFTDVADKAGVRNDRFCKGVTAGDYDNDGDTDLFLSNVGRNRLYRNNSDGTFTDVATQLGLTGTGGFSFTPWFFDYNNDGWLDIFVSAFEATLQHHMQDARGAPHSAPSPHLYRNNGNGTFTDVAGSSGLHHPYLPMGANFGDIDNDGWLDIFLATGDSSFETLTPNVLLRNEAGKQFNNVTSAARLGHLQKGHGLAFADFDRDGDLDLYHQLGGFFPGDRFHNALFLNPGNGNTFIDLRCRGTTTNRSAFGVRAALTIQFPDGRTQTFHRAGGSLSSFGGSPHDSLHFGIPASARPLSLRLQWPASGISQTFTENLALNSVLEAMEGESDLRLREHP